MRKTFFLLFIIFSLNGCAQSFALLGTSAGGASSGKIVQSSINSVTSYGIKKYTGKTPLGHAFAYAEKHNPDKKKETCLSFIQKTNSEVCTILKKKLNTTKSKIIDKKNQNKFLKKNSSSLQSKINKKSNIKYLD
ncbi:hypothetical protein OAW36_02820 [Pelagibacteraceae bacterium]|nr:hypothetical protein [Pelagibacteraceae bacterium]